MTCSAVTVIMGSYRHRHPRSHKYTYFPNVSLLIEFLNFPEASHRRKFAGFELQFVERLLRAFISPLTSAFNGLTVSRQSLNGGLIAN